MIWRLVWFNFGCFFLGAFPDSLLKQLVWWMLCAFIAEMGVKQR